MTARAMVLAAGLGTRLRPLTFELPKPMMPVGDRPLIAHIAERLGRAGFGKLVVNTHHLPDAFINLSEEIGIEAQVLHEPEILGSAGGIAGARAHFGPAPVIVWNGDILTDPPLSALQTRARTEGGLVLAYVSRPTGTGTIGVGEGGRVVRLRGERFGEELEGADYIGIAALGARCLETLPERGCLIGDWALPELRAGRPPSAVRSASEFWDIGDKRRYLDLNLKWLADQGLSSWVGPKAEIDPNVHIEESLVGAGARISGTGDVRRSVVWPGAQGNAPLGEAILTTAGRLVLV